MYRSVIEPSNTSAAMPTDSLRVGCGWMVWPQVAGFAAHLDRQRDLGDQVAGANADDAAADDAVRRRIEHQLGEAFAAAEADRAARGGPRELRGLHGHAGLLRFGFGESDPGHLGVGVGDRRNDARDPLALLPGGHFRRQLCLVGRLVRQHRLPDDVADRVDVRQVGAHLPVDLDEAAIADLHAGLVGVDGLAVGRAADRDQHAVELRGGGNALAFEAGVQAVLLRLDLRDLGLQVHRDAALLQHRRQRPHQVGVGAGHQLVHEFDHGDLAAQRGIHAGHLQAR
jgi:hypothetical protein